VLEIALDHRAAGLDEVDVAVMDLAERVVDDATSIGDADLQRLATLGSRRRRSWTSSSPLPRAASSRRRSTRSASSRTRATGGSRRIFATRSSSAGRSPTPDA
jgi:hypothetical protein